ncbi:hypothetical protein [Flavobacterium sp.]|uniref:hypothetical protein n=1 Tax=Flavobacterium sp. TaxID=239 RepID=UPI004047533C
MQNRVDIKNFIVQIERDFSVNKWQVNGIHLWPILRIKLCFFLIYQVESEKNDFKQNVSGSAPVISTFRKKLFQIKRNFQKAKESLKFYIWKSKLPQKNYIFLGGDAHRVNYKNARFNRFFDVLISKYAIENQSLYFEYGNQLEKNQYQPEKVYFYEKFFLGFQYLYRLKSRQVNFNWTGFSLFEDFLLSNELTHDFILKNNRTEIENWATSLFLPKIAFFTEVIRKIQPKQIHFLCYYSDFNYALLVAANQLKITTVEMQHGPQTDIHLSYGSWTVVPSEGYAVLPRVFWNWDENSASVLNKWMQNNTTYKVKVIGNPWMDYWRAMSQSYANNNFILYSLQPNPITLEQLFTPQLLDCIRSSSEIWFLRLHPRQMNEKDALINFFKKENLLHKINIEAATNDPLPQLLANAKLHVTHFSGTTIEASFFNLKTILLNKNGLVSFPELIAKNQAIYIDYKDEDFVSKFKSNLISLEKPEISPIFEQPIVSNLFP